MPIIRGFFKKMSSINCLFKFGQKPDIGLIMLKNTFIHIQSIGAITEQRLWESGISSWDSIDGDLPSPVAPRRKHFLLSGIEESRRHLAGCNPAYFSKLLPANQSWRLFPEFRDSTVYLDIETTGLDRYFNEITTIALYDGKSISTYVKGQNLDDFIEDIQKYQVIVSYNGKSFDVPFIENYFNIRLAQAHIDLRYVLSSLGFRGGLKGCERQLDMDRGDLKDIDGFFAVLLWDEYRKTGDQKVLETLLAYNVQDTINLENLMVTAYNMKHRKTPFYEKLLIEESPAPVNPFRTDLGIVDKIKGGSQYWQSLNYH
jgi:uncharacterized protein YprB with RNaseH-like and TPR domain